MLLEEESCRSHLSEKSQYSGKRMNASSATSLLDTQGYRSTGSVKQVHFHEPFGVPMGVNTITYVVILQL